MAIGTPLGVGNHPGTTQTNTPSVTLPNITADGVAYLLIGINLTTATLTTAPAGWTLVDGPQNNGNNNARVWLYKRAVTSADSGATVSAVLSATGRWAAAVLYFPGGDDLGVVSFMVDNAADLTLAIDAITPTVDNAYRAVLVYDRYTSATGSATPPSGWTELVDACSTNTSGARFGAYAAGVQLVGQSGVTQPATSGTYSAAAQNIGWQFTVRPTPPAAATGTADLSGSGVLSAVGAVAVAAVVALTGSGSLGAAGTPVVARAAALSGAGSLAAQGVPSTSGTAALGGTGSLTAQGWPATGTTATLSGPGALGATGSPSTTGTAALSGAGALAVTGAPTAAGTASLAGVGALAAFGAPGAAGAAALGGSGQLTALNTSASALAALGGTGTLAATGRPAISSTATLTGAGSLTAAARPGVATAAALSGVGTLSATTLPGVTVTVVLVGTGDLSATSLPNLATAAALTGDGALAASGALGPPPETAPPVLGGRLQLADPATSLDVDVESGLSVNHFDSSLNLTAPETRLEITT